MGSVIRPPSHPLHPCCLLAAALSSHHSLPPPSQVTSDGSGLGAAWHLDQVEVFDTTRAASTVFPCGEWLDPKDPMTLQQVCVWGVKGAGGRGGGGLKH